MVVANKLTAKTKSKKSVKKGKSTFSATAKKMKNRQIAEAKGKEAAAFTKLKPVAKEINTRLDKANKMSSDAFDHRLAAAIRLEDARKMCKIAGVIFKKWAEANVIHSYETVRKLTAVGGASDPALALADLRLATRKAVAKHTAKKNAVLANTNDKTDGGPVHGGTHSAPSRTPWEIAEDMVASLPEKEQISLVEARASLLGRKVITSSDAEMLRSYKAPGKVSDTLKGMKKAFEMMKASEKMKFLKWAATSVGATVESSLGNDHDDAPIPEKGGEAIPDSMRRQELSNTDQILA